MTRPERKELQRLIDTAVRQKLDDGRRHRGDKTRCSRCERPIDDCGGTSPQRSWGRHCETRRKLDQYHSRTRTAAA